MFAKKTYYGFWPVTERESPCCLSCSTL